MPNVRAIPPEPPDDWPHLGPLTTADPVVGTFTLTPTGRGVPVEFWSEMLEAISTAAADNGLRARFRGDLAHVELVRIDGQEA